MILECSECRTRYLVPDNAVGPQGRTVRCAHCKHSWHQEPEPAQEPEIAASPAEPEPPEILPAAPEQPQPSIADRFHEAKPIGSTPGKGTDFDPYAQKPLLRARINPARRHTMIAVLAGAVLLAGAGALFYVGAPGIGSQIGLAQAQDATPLKFVNTRIERGVLSSGNELFAVSGRIVNPGGERERIPDIRAELRDLQKRVVYSWTITPPQRAIGPGQGVEFNSATLDVPANAKLLRLAFSGE